MSTPVRPVVVSLTQPSGTQSAAHSGHQDASSRHGPVHVEAGGFVMRSLVPDDATPRVLEWLSAQDMTEGLNLPGLDFDLVQLRQFIAQFDNYRHYFIGIFDRETELLVGFYTIDVDTNHKLGHITTGIGEHAYHGRQTLWATNDAVLDHFFDKRDVDKMSARILAKNYRMIFAMKESPRFFLEARLRQECLAANGERLDILQFAAFKSPPQAGWPS